MRGKKGFSLIEALIVMALLTVLVVKVTMLMQMQQESESRTSTVLAVEDNARRVMEQITYAVMGASQETLEPGAGSSSEVRFSVSLGVVDGEVVWDDEEWVGLTDAAGQLAWKERPDAADERRVVWCNAVRPFLSGEQMNGIDDNGNGLVDEKGLTFTIEGRKVTVWLTLERKDTHGRTVEAKAGPVTVVCRN